jgi:hypothetical protein
MTQLTRVARTLRRGATEYPGLTVAQIAARASLSKEDVPKRVYDLRSEEGRTIYTNTRKVAGKTKTFYRFAG